MRRRLSFASFASACVIALLLLGSAVSVNSSTTSVAYDSTPSPLPPNVVSLGFQATQTAELGDDIQLTMTDPYLTDVTVTMSDWAKHSSYPSVGTATDWTHPITLNVYNVDTAGVHPALGSLITTVTQTATIPWRPEHDASCPGDAWLAGDASCYNGLAFNLTFSFAQPIRVPQQIILGIAYNTQTWGADPIGVDGPYTSLNVGLNDVAGPTVGIDSEPDAIFWNTSTAGWYNDGGAGGVGVFRRDDNWAPYVPMFQVSAESGCTTDCYVDAASGDDANTGVSTSAAKKTIGAAVDEVSPGGTVHVAAGTYAENVAINKALELAGAGQADTTIVPSFVGFNPGGGGSLPAGSSNVILVQSSDVEIHDLTVDGDNPALTGGTNVGGANIDARNGIITDHTLGPVFNNLSIHDTTIKNIWLRGIYASSGGTFNFSDNTVDNVQARPRLDWHLQLGRRGHHLRQPRFEYQRCHLGQPLERDAVPRQRGDRLSEWNSYRQRGGRRWRR